MATAYMLTRGVLADMIGKVVLFEARGAAGACGTTSTHLGRFMSPFTVLTHLTNLPAHFSPQQEARTAIPRLVQLTGAAHLF